MNGEKPATQFRAGAISASVWQNQGKNKEGDSFNYNTISLQRTYKDKNGEWQHTNSFRINDLPRATLVLKKAYEHILLKQGDSDESGASIPEEVVV